MEDDISKLEYIISILNSKGYKVDVFSLANAKLAFRISLIFCDLEGKIDKDLFESMINREDCEGTVIVFEKKYEFSNLPENFVLLDESLIGILSFYENKKFINLKDLQINLKAMLDNLEIWAKSL